MENSVTLKPMTHEMYHSFFKEYRNDLDLYLDKRDFYEYCYDQEKVDAYIKRQVDLKRLQLAIMYGDETLVKSRSTIL